VQHFSLGGENGRVFFAEFPGNRLATFFDLSRDAVKSRVITLELAFHKRAGDEAARDAEPLVADYQGIADSDPRRNRYALQNVHRSGRRNGGNASGPIKGGVENTLVGSERSRRKATTSFSDSPINRLVLICRDCLNQHRLGCRRKSVY